MKTILLFSMAVFSQLPCQVFAVGDAQPMLHGWGALYWPNHDGQMVAVVNKMPDDGVLLLRSSKQKLIPNITRVRLADSHEPTGITLSFNTDATEIKLHVPAALRKTHPLNLVLETAENTTQRSDGLISLSALDAKVVGKQAKLETHPGSHRIGFWSNEKDYVSWNYNASRWGMYDAYLTYSAAGGDGTTVNLELADKKLGAELSSTGSWYVYRTIKVGRIYMAKAGKQTINVKCTKKTGAAVMNLKAVTFVPACEGKTPVQKDDGSIVLYAGDVTIQGVKLRWEPIEKKRTVGFWANENDWCYWDFKVTKPGTFNVQILQGCGKNNGGSVAAFTIAGQTMKHTVIDTGHWQNFKPMDIGTVKIDKPGTYRCMVKPVKKAKVAVMDLRQVTLTPVNN